MIKLNIVNGTIESVECSTAREAAEYTHKLNHGDFNREYSAQDFPRLDVRDSPISQNSGELGAFIKKIKSLNESLVSSGDLAKVLGVSEIQGLGPRLRGIGNKFKETYSRDLSEVIYKENTPPGQESKWRINVFKLDEF